MTENRVAEARWINIALIVAICLSDSVESLLGAAQSDPSHPSPLPFSDPSYASYKQLHLRKRGLRRSVMTNSEHH